MRLKKESTLSVTEFGSRNAKIFASKNKKKNRKSTDFGGERLPHFVEFGSEALDLHLHAR